jgi:rhodanese-related sulfurtransferase
MTSCSSNGTTENATSAPITVEAARGLHGRAGVEFIDPRPAEAIASTTGKIPGARVISIENLESGNLPPAFNDRTIHVITSCQAGPMAARAASALADLGFARVNWVKGGTQAWVDAGYDTVR